MVKSAGWAFSVRFAIVAMFAALSMPAVATAQYQKTNTEAVVVCPGVIPPGTLTPVEFAKNNLTSLWYARNAAERGAEIERAAKEAANSFALATAMMRITKAGSNDLVCAKRSILPFAVGKADGNIVTAAQLLVVVYQAHMDINRRSLEVLEKMDTLPPAELSDQLSTLQVERGQRWADLVEPTSRALLSLLDLKRVENYRMPYLIVTKAERKGLIDWAVDHFPEFGNGTPKDKWSDPAKAANVYISLLADKKSADEK